MATFFRITGMMWADFFAYYVLWMMMIYLTDVWKLNFTHAAAIINVWRGSALILPLAFFYLSGAFLGNFCIVLLTSLSYSIGLGLLWMSTPPVLGKSSNNCTEYKPECIGEQQKQLFYAALVLIAAGIAGHFASLGSFINDQMEKLATEFNSSADGSVCCSILGAFMGILIPIIGLIVVSLVKSWGVQFGICALFGLASLLVFLSGVCSYKYVGPRGSSLTTVFRVFFAALSKIACKRPQDETELYEMRNVDQNVAFQPHTNSLRCLDNAAIILPQPTLEQQKQNRWRLCRVTEVEATKTLVRSIPLWVTLLFCGVVSAIGDTYFLKQATTLNPKLGRIKVPLVLFLAFYDQTKSLFAKWFVLMANIIMEGSPTRRRYVAPIGIAVAMVFSILCCITASKVEERRLGIVKGHGLIDKPDERVPMTIFWLIPQFAFLGALDGIRGWSVPNLLVGQAPRSMLGLINFIHVSMLGIGYIGSAISVYVVGRVSKKDGGINWFQSTLNKSRLDNYYWVLAVLSAINLVVYIVVAYFCGFKDPGEEVLEEPEFEETENNIFNHVE